MIKLQVPEGDWVDALRMYGQIWGYLDENVTHCHPGAKNSKKSNVIMVSVRDKDPNKRWGVIRYNDHIEVNTSPEIETLLLLKYNAA